MKKIKKEVTLSLEFYKGKQDVKKGIFEGNVVPPKHLDELFIDVFASTTYDFESDDFVENGGIDLQLQGSNRAFRELGKYLLAITEYDTEDPRYHDHFDGIQNSDEEEKVNLTIYKPFR
ncbi:hypothetical protein AB5N96_08090 [Chryseomicrobium imtechense]